LNEPNKNKQVQTREGENKHPKESMNLKIKTITETKGINQQNNELIQE